MIASILAWGRPLDYEPKVMHAIVDLGETSGSIVTACKGRWSRDNESSLIVRVDDVKRDPDPAVRTCGACIDHAFAVIGETLGVDMNADIRAGFECDFEVKHQEVDISGPASATGSHIPRVYRYEMGNHIELGGEA